MQLSFNYFAEWQNFIENKEKEGGKKSSLFKTYEGAKDEKENLGSMMMMLKIE